MNSSYNAALKQSSNLRRDLAECSSKPASLTAAQVGQLSTSLTVFSRTVDDYSSWAKKELIPARKEKAFERLKIFRDEVSDYRGVFDKLKKERDQAQSALNGDEVFGRRPFSTSTPENPYLDSTSTPPAYGASSYETSYFDPELEAREDHALREHSFASAANNQLDAFIARGQAVLGDLHQQHEMLKSVQRRVYSVANALGISGDTIRRVETRAKQDRWIFWAGVVVFFLFCWAVLKIVR